MGAGFLLGVWPGLAWTGPVGGSANIAIVEGWSIGMFGKSSRLEPVIDVARSQAITVPISGDETGIFAEANATIKLEQAHDLVGAEIAYKPGDGLLYRLWVGQVRRFELAYSSGPLVNVLEADRDGLLWGAGAGWSLVPGTAVTPAVSMEAAYTQTRVRLDRFQSGGDVSASDHALVQENFSVALQVSRRLRAVEPFVGLRLHRFRTALSDRGTRQNVKGRVDGATVFGGLEWEIFRGERLALEASFGEERAVGAAIRLPIGRDGRW